MHRAPPRPPDPAPDRVLATTADGELEGRAADGVVRFQGVPYAAPPVGQRRWARPEPPVPWPGVRAATRPGPRCPQGLPPVGAPGTTPTSSDPGTAEDCLTLAVTAPAGTAPGAALPVLVWVHGGGFAAGAGSDYDPARLVVEGGLVVVTLNHRLGALGFLGLPGLAGSGAFGLLDVPGTALTCLRGRPVEELIAPGIAYPSPATGTPTVPMRPSDATAAGYSAAVPVLTGTTREEGAGFVADSFQREPIDASAFAGMLGWVAGARARRGRARLPVAGGDAQAAWSRVVTDRAHACPDLGDGQERLAQRMRGLWAAFARTGDPGAPGWTSFGADGPVLTLAVDAVAPQPASAFAAAHRCHLWS